ncbi:hypothetical protein ACHAXT_004910 [Thalassiosira profunda]
MTIVDVGTPPDDFERWEAHLVRFHDFAKLSKQKGIDCTRSPKFTCAGHSWTLQIHPGGWKTSSDGWVAMFLYHQGLGSVSKIKFNFHVKDGSHESRARTTTGLVVEPNGFEGDGYTNFAMRADLLNLCVGTTLIVEVRMKVLEQDSFFVPQNPSSNALHTFLGETPNIVFEAGGNQKRRNTRSSLDPATAEFRGHESVLENHAPQLLKIISREKGSNKARVLIPTVKPEIFRHVLRYAYGGELPKDALEKHSKEIVEAASHYAMPQLKLTAEAWFVQTAQINEDTLEGHLIFSRNNNLALLKEAAVDFIVKSGFDTDGLSDKAQISLSGDIQRATNEAARLDKFCKMRVNELRKRLEEKGLDIGGSKKQMIDALREAAKSD